MILPRQQFNHALRPLPLLTVSTRDIAPRGKLEYWRDVVCDKIVPLEFGLVGHGPFEATLKWIDLSSIRISQVTASAHSAAHTVANVNRTGSDTIIVNFIIDGTCDVAQDGRTARITAGSGTFCNATRPYSLTFNDNLNLLVLTLPHNILKRGAASADRATACDLRSASKLFPLVSTYLGQLIQCAPHLTVDSAERLSNNFAELVCAMLSDIVQQAPISLSDQKTATLTRIYSYIEQNLADPGLSSASVSQALRLSPRYINQLLEAEGTSLFRLLLRRRLERIARDMLSPAFQSRNISTIALLHGFNDVTHFSKAFRQCFGMSPREYRRTMSSRYSI